VLKLVLLGRDLVEWDSGQFLRLNGLHLHIIERFFMTVILDGQREQREQSQESRLQEEGVDVRAIHVVQRIASLALTVPSREPGISADEDI
jgi:hypothetical protein